MDKYNELRNALMKCEKRNNGTCKATNKVKCAQRIIKKHINGDKDELLKLKAQSKFGNLEQMRNYNLALGAFFVSFIAMLVSIVLDSKVNEALTGRTLLIYILLVSVIAIIILKSNKKLRDMSIWNEYMNVAIEELEKEFE